MDTCEYEPALKASEKRVTDCGEGSDARNEENLVNRKRLEHDTEVAPSWSRAAIRAA